MLLTVLDGQYSNRREPLPHHQPAKHPDALTQKTCLVTDPEFNQNVSSLKLFEWPFQDRESRQRSAETQSSAVSQCQSGLSAQLTLLWEFVL